MGFDVKKFSRAKFEDRTQLVSVPDLQEWFGDGEDTAFKIRGLTGPELARCFSASSRNDNLSAVAAALAGANAEKIDAMRELMGVTADVEKDMVFRMEQFAIGVVEPDIDHTFAVKFASAFPGEFYQITNKITSLTNMGRQVAKKKNSGDEEK